MNTIKAIGVAAAGLALGSVAAQAHHSYAAFDASKEVSIEGVVKNVRFANPHVVIVVTKADADGNATDWFFEANSVRSMTTAGWRKSTLEVGDTVTLVGHPMRDGQPGASLTHAILSDGTTLKSSGGSNY